MNNCKCEKQGKCKDDEPCLKAVYEDKNSLTYFIEHEFNKKTL